MAEPIDARCLFESLSELGVELSSVADRVPSIRVELADGSVLDVFKADRVQAHLQMWRVIGFERAVAGDSADRERRALILGTRDGRAMLTSSLTSALDEGMNGQLVTGMTKSSRSLDEVSEAMARAVRRLLSGSD